MKKYRILHLRQTKLNYVCDPISYDVAIEFKLVNGEYHYIPRANTFLNDVKLSIKDLEEILKELKALNKGE